MARGKLAFKGEGGKKKSKKSKHKKSGDEHLTLSEGAAAVAPESGSSAEQLDASLQPPPPQGAAAAVAKGGTPGGSQEQGPQIKSGRGLISTSGTVVQGHGTAFQKEIRAGDAILARAANGADEMRVVKMVLSNVSISVSSAFSSDLKTPTPFSYICKPRDDRTEKAAKTQKALNEKEEVEARAMGTYGNKGEIVYREKTSQGSYRIRKEQATTEMSRSDLLSFRAKKKSDRYC